MLMECLAAGRAISLPALGAATQQAPLFVANGYDQIREQFGLPIGKFDAVASAITVEGANILTRSLIIFGQGAVRRHPFVMREMQARQ